jgi:hypothetical protein
VAFGDSGLTVEMAFGESTSLLKQIKQIYWGKDGCQRNY